MDTPKTPSVSVIIAAHNRPDLLAEAIRSVCRQTYPALEVIVVDDGSTPPLDVIPLQASCPPTLRVVRHEKPQRTAAAKNSGIKAAQGDLVAFLDDDDLLAPRFIETAVHALSTYPDREVLFMGVSWFGKFGPQGEAAYREGMSKLLRDVETEEPESSVLMLGKTLYGALLHRVPMAFQRTVVRRKAFDHVGLYREGCAIQDCDWAIRAARRVPCALSTAELYLQRTDGQGAASRPARKMQHMRARIEIYEHLMRLAEQAEMLPGEAQMLRQSLAGAWFDLAYHQAKAHNPLDGINALLRSQRTYHVFRRWRLALLLGLEMVRFKWLANGAKNTSSL